MYPFTETGRFICERQDAALTTPGAASLFLTFCWKGARSAPAAPNPYPPPVGASISPDRIEEAAHVIDPVFLHSPQFVCEPLSERLGVITVLKVESINPIRSFKGRGADYLMHTLGDDSSRVVCASAGNFGQGMAYACRKRGRHITVFAAHTANPLKIDRMRALDAHVEVTGDDFDQAKDAAKRHAESRGDVYIEDGRIAAITEGAGTIALELGENEEPLDAIFVPLGNGALVNGIGTWIKHHSLETRVIAVCAQNAPAMALSFQARTPTRASSATIADGIAVRVPVPEAVDAMASTVDEVMLVSDDEMILAMRHLLSEAGLVVEPAGAVGVAAIAQRSQQLRGSRVAAILTGGNLTGEQIALWLGGRPTGARGRRGSPARPVVPAG
ncbi:MAG: threonine/serine dehydratase [Chloroflexi bacterium]|nr:MAG: threonine/serine dehydratase [Chloroflexota bacterium]